MNATLINTPIPESANKPNRVGLPRAWSLNVRHRVCHCWLASSAPATPADGTRRMPATFRARRGLSLLEVLVSVFVLTLGLMGIAMVIPAGNALMNEALKSDRSAACGRAALNDIQVRRWYQPGLWKQKWGGIGVFRSAIVNSGEYSNTGTNDYLIYDVNTPPNRNDNLTGLIYGEVFFLDPFFTLYGNNDLTDTVRHFPYTGYPDREFTVGTGPYVRQWPERALARRVGFPIHEALAERITTWADELVFSLESDNARPRQSFTWTDGKDWPFPVLRSDEATMGTGDYPLVASGNNQYTWSAMISPVMPSTELRYTTNDATWDHDNDGNMTTPGIPLVNPATVTQYEISIVVFQNRTLPCIATPAEIYDATDAEAIRERSVYAKIVGGGVSGGDVLLFVPGTGVGTTNVPTNPPAGYLEVRKDQWIMLKAVDRSRPVRTYNNSGVWVETPPTVCKWYRVVSVDDEFTIDASFTPPFLDPSNLTGPALTGRGRYVTLAGPDWQVDTTDDGSYPRFNPATDIAEAALIEDVVGVVSTTVDIREL